MSAEQKPRTSGRGAVTEQEKPVDLWPSELGAQNHVLWLITQVQDMVDRAYRRGVKDGMALRSNGGGDGQRPA